MFWIGTAVASSLEFFCKAVRVEVGQAGPTEFVDERSRCPRFPGLAVKAAVFEMPGFA